uniref:DnaJ homolog dnj-5 (inferred by orthology to a C. elegans protein) n=1 Tax=Anisakis simplex TaxID=6269 RepID=A0A158PNY3_ANISI
LRFASSNNGNSSSTNAQNMVARRVNSSQRTSSERQSVASDSVVDYLVNHHTTLLSSSDNNHHKSSSIVNSTNAYAKRVTENEFQKITHKKNKGCKGNKNEQIILDEDGISGNQAVDASSRFDILQSLGSQSATTLLHHHPNIPLSRRSRSSGVSQRDTQGGAASNKSSLKASFSSSTQQDSQSMKGNSLTSQMFDEETNSEEIRHTSNINKVPSTLSQRSVAKKILFGNRREYNDQNDSSQRASITRKQRAAARKRQNTAFDYLHLILLAIFSLLKRAAQWITDLVVDISLQLRDITVYALLWNSLRSLNAKKLWSSRENERGEWGLSDNIQLPTTGDEAMERLLRCHGQDAYVVLGLRADCADDDIKRYYKRQAVLVHPDKNHSSGADEAFKILSRAFDAIGTPEARNKYNLANLHKNPLHKEMEELWERLREKMNEARNTMHCDCGKKHARIPVEGCRASEARYCKKCRVRHPAKHNDIWAETRCGGLWWVYYACLDGIVYDITQWAACPNNRLKHMKANSHTVQYRLISTTGSSVNKSDPSSKHNKKSGHHHHQQQQQHEFSDLDYMNSDIFGGAKSSEIRCGCSSTMQMGYNDRCGACYGSSHEKTIGINANACCAAAGIASPCSSSHAHSQQASYRPPDRRALDGDRPRRAGRRRKVR